MARIQDNIYKALTWPTQGTQILLETLTVILLLCLFYKELHCSNFGIRAVVAGTTPVTISKKQSSYTRNHPEESLDPSEHIQLN